MRSYSSCVEYKNCCIFLFCFGIFFLVFLQGEFFFFGFSFFSKFLGKSLFSWSAGWFFSLSRIIFVHSSTKYNTKKGRRKKKASYTRINFTHLFRNFFVCFFATDFFREFLYSYGFFSFQEKWITTFYIKKIDYFFKGGFDSSMGNRVVGKRDSIIRDDDDRREVAVS